MDVFYYVGASLLYIMTIHFAFATKGQFNLFMIAGAFFFGGVVGWYIGSYAVGFAISIILSLFIW